ncbi:MAG: T9SS type A sorting domain-containing protein, partial [Candidatus Cloacimonadota bacterium]
VYDVSGRLTDVLIDGVVESGYHSIGLDTKGYASGIYFYRLIAGGKTFTRKMIVVK